VNRKAMIEHCFQRGHLLTLAHDDYRTCVDDHLSWLINNDHTETDLTSDALGLHSQTLATVRAKQVGTLAGIEEILHLLSQRPAIDVRNSGRDGDALVAGDVVLELSLDAAELLRLERTILNVIGRMSGIATQTQQLVQLATESGQTLVAGTRKTPWMLLDKKAVYCGGGLTHRLSLGDMVLVKDNHLAAFQKESGSTSPEQTVSMVVNKLNELSKPPLDYFEVEVESVSQARAALSAFGNALKHHSTPPTMIIMLDNFRPKQAKAFIEEVLQGNIYEHVLFEASGDITEATIPMWAKTGIDVVSLGALTHSVKNFNVSMALS
jgi:nicotinate-nucleotide pyrophosphorylase (carboxylating)